MPLLFDAEHRPIQTLAAWTRRRTDIRRAWLSFLGAIEGPRPRNSIKVLQEDHPQGVVRQLIAYETEPGLVVEGYLLRPDRPGHARPGVVVLHATTAETIRQPAGLDGHPDLHIGLHLAQRGYVALAPGVFCGNTPTPVSWRPLLTGCTPAIPK